MADKKIVTLEQLARNNTKVKEKLNEKISKKGDQTLDGSLVTTGNISIQGNLEVKGTTSTVNQETLTIKDNFIGINGNGTTLDTAGKTGIIAITGEEQAIIKDGKYKFDVQALLDYIELQAIYDPDVQWADAYGPYYLVWNHSKVEEFNNLRLYNYATKEYWDNVGADAGWGDVDTILYLDMSAPTVNIQYLYNTMGTIHVCVSMSGYSITFSSVVEIELKNQLVRPQDLNILSKILKNSSGSVLSSKDVIIGAQAYAAPIYDKNNDTLKIGLGTYEKDVNGNITDFTFGAGQGQSIATRSDNIRDGAILAWDGSTNRLVDANFNLENGNVQDSLVQKYTGKVTDDGLYAPNTNTGISSVVFGEANNNTAKRSFLVGKLNDSNAPNSIVAGLYNGSPKLSKANGGPLTPLQGANLIVGGEMNQNIQTPDTGTNTDSSAVILSGKHNYNKDSRNVILSGEDNTNDTSPHSIMNGTGNTNINSESSLVLGRNNANANSSNSIVNGTNNNNGFNDPDDATKNIVANESILSGDGINNKAPYSALFGRYLTNSGAYSIVGGIQGKNTGPYSIVLGEANSNQATNGVLLGRYLVNYNGYCTVIGRSNKISSDAIFQIGNGWGGSDPYDSRRSNAFEVTTNGVARAYGTPTEDYDLVTIKKLKEVAEDLGNCAVNFITDEHFPEAITIKTWNNLINSNYTKTISIVAKHEQGSYFWGTCISCGPTSNAPLPTFNIGNKIYTYNCDYVIGDWEDDNTIPAQIIDLNNLNTLTNGLTDKQIKALNEFAKNLVTEEV